MSEAKPKGDEHNNSVCVCVCVCCNSTIFKIKLTEQQNRYQIIKI